MVELSVWDETEDRFVKQMERLSNIVSFRECSRRLENDLRKSPCVGTWVNTTTNPSGYFANVSYNEMKKVLLEQEVGE